MSIAEGLQAGIGLHQYINELPRKEEEARLKAQLFKSQADHLNAQTGLLTLQQQREQGFQTAMQQALTQPPPPSQGQAMLPPDLANQPAGPNPGAPSIGTLHDTTMFADPDNQQMLKMSRTVLAAAPGNPVAIKHAATLAQGALEIQKAQIAYRDKQLQDMMAFYQQNYDNLPDVPANAADRDKIRQAQVAILFKQGKNKEAMDMLSGKLVPVPVAGTLTQTLPGQPTKAVFQSPTTLAQKAFQERQGVNAADFGESPPGAMRQPQARSAPLSSVPGTPDEITQLTQQLRQADPSLTEEAAARMAVTVLKAMAPALQPAIPAQQPALAGQNPVAKRARIQHEQDILSQGLIPGDPTNTVPRQKEEEQLRGQTGVKGATRETLAAQQSKGAAAGEGLQVGPGAKSVQEQKDEIAQRTQALPSSEVDKLAPLLDVRSYLEELRTIPEAKMQQYVGLLRGPLAKVQQVIADTLDGPGKGDPDLHKFLSIVNQIFYTTNRPETGANFSGVEKEMVNGIYATGTERSYTEFKAKLDRLDKTLETRIGNRTALTMSTRGNTGKVMEKPTEGTQTPAQETPQQLYDRKKKELGLH